MNHPHIKISAYKAWKGKPGCKPYDTDFYTEMQRIKDGYYKDIATRYRSITDKDQKYQYKVSELPSISISAVCKNWRNLENVVHHTGLLNLDIDKKSNEHIQDWGALRDQIFGLKGVVASFLSVSGEGVTFVIKIHPDQHKDVFFSVVDEMKQHMGINVDPGLHDIVRLRFVSDDPDTKIRFNYDEIPFIGPSEQYLNSKKSYGHEQSVLEPIGDADSEYNFKEAVKKAELLYTFSEGSKWSFLISVAGSCNIMGMSLKFCQDCVVNHFRSQTNISTDRLLKPVTSVYKLYKHQHGTFDIELKAERLTSKVRNHLVYEWLHNGKKPMKEDLVPIGEQFHVNVDRLEIIIDRVYGEYADEFGYNEFPKVRRVEIWLSKRWKFRYNKITAQPEVSEHGSQQVVTVNPDEIYRQLCNSKFKFPIGDVKSLIKSEFVKPYDPILEYFQSLTYDGKTDHISRLASYITTKEGDYWGKMFRKSLIRSILCGLGLKENRIVMVLYQPKEETGKSSYIRFLNPWGGAKYFTESPIIGGNVKDTEIRFSENFIYNIEELAGLNRADINKLKADISKAGIKERRPHAMFETFAPRRCNFWASTNQKEFLHDDGNTRWLIFEVTDINWDYVKDISIHDVWAQAWHLYQSGESGELDREDKSVRENINKDYRFIRSEEELIPRHFQPTEPNVGYFYSASEIAGIVNKLYAGSLHVNPNNIGKTIRNIWGLESCQVKIKGKNTRGYWLNHSFNEADGENRNNWPPPATNDEFHY